MGNKALAINVSTVMSGAAIGIISPQDGSFEPFETYIDEFGEGQRKFIKFKRVRTKKEGPNDSLIPQEVKFKYPVFTPIKLCNRMMIQCSLRRLCL